MITYELCLLLRVMPKSELVSALKRTANTIFLKGGIIRKLESLGTKHIPSKTSSHGLVHNKARYLLLVTFTLQGR
ncbi:Ribosomal protein S6 [Popillia japonica]|uniref:Small ribosomal subunit protein bS6m n=1 Tax=Popillia japonica TaxID=7064 RepID=A0AAW1JHT4_POPJA